MDKNQIDVAIRKLNTLATYSRDRIINDLFLKNEYVAYLTKMSWNDFNDVFRDLQQSCKELPKIAEIKTFYNRLLQTRQESKKSGDCSLCGGLGWVEYTEIWNNTEYEQCARCICPAGQQYDYDFSKSEDPHMRWPKRVACIAEIFDIEKLKAERGAKMNKYHNRKTEMDGILFDSVKESKRYTELKLLERAGKIRDLERQKKFEICAKSKGRKALYYIADFVYWDNVGNQIIVEDVKGYKTPVYNLKKRLVYEKYGIEIKEV